MSELMQNLPQIAAAYTLYLVAVISPGPAIIAIISTALGQGRKRALIIALGIFAGSFTWAMAAALGLAAILSRFAEVLVVLKICGGLYLLYLAYKASRNVMRKSTNGSIAAEARDGSFRRTFLKGYAIHVTNPKAIFGWLAIISLGLPPGASVSAVALIVGGCLVTGLTVFIGYALLFSTRKAARIYQTIRRPLDAVMALMFGAAGVKLIASGL